MTVDKYSRHGVDILDELDKDLRGITSSVDLAREEYRRLLNLAEDSGFMTDYTHVLGGELFSQLSRLLDELNGLLERERTRIPEHRRHICDLELEARLGNI